MIVSFRFGRLTRASFKGKQNISTACEGVSREGLLDVKNDVTDTTFYFFFSFMMTGYFVMFVTEEEERFL